MKPKLIALNILLVLALVAIVWQARARWSEAQSKRRDNLSVRVKPLPTPPITPVPKPEAAPATKYADVATKDLFSKDRNPDVVIEPPKIEAPKKMPPLPVVYGVLGLPDGTRAIMAEKSGEASKSVHAGDTIGPFTIAALDPQNVTFDWDGKHISRKIEDLIDRSNGPGAAGAQSAAVQPGGNVAVVQAAPPPPPQSNAPTVTPAPGKDTGGGIRSCLPGDTSPSGTVANGYKKSIGADTVRPDMQLDAGSVNGDVKMKSVIAAVILFAVTLGAQTNDAKDKKSKKKSAAPAPQAMTIPKDAAANSDGISYVWTDKQGKKWVYAKTPFGITRSPASDTTANIGPDLSTTKAVDKGDTVRFERPSPFGPMIWEKKKVDLTDDERHLLDGQNAKTEQKND